MNYRQNGYFNDYEDEKYYQNGRQNFNNYSYSTYPEDCYFNGRCFDECDGKDNDWGNKNYNEKECQCPKCRKERNECRERRCPKYDYEEKCNCKKNCDKHEYNNDECENNSNNRRRNCGFCGFFRIFRCK